MKFAAETIRANPRRLEIILICVLLAVSLLSRLLDLGTFLTADEKTWIVRSYEFIRAVKDVRLNDTLQTTHPGVTTLWISGLAVTAKMFVSHLPFTSNGLIQFIKTAQFPIALLNALAIPLIYIFLKKITGRKLAFGAAFLIALDPFIIGYSRVIHVDALLGSFLTLAVLATMLYAKTLQRTWLVVSAICSALALLTKVPAVFIVPFFPLAVAVLQISQLRSRAFIIERVRDVLLWALGIVLIVIIIWPALLWVPNPFGNVLLIQRDVSVAATTPHNMLEEYSLKPLHYPAALLTRSNPISLIGAIIGIVGLIILGIKKKLPREVFLIAVYLVGFVVMMTLGAKKGDRYIMPAFFALDILAAYGIFLLASVIPGRRKNPRRVLVLCILLTAYLLTTVVSYHPYEVSYSNPLFPDNLSQELGWGEGLEQVGTWLNTNYPKETVASWYPEELDAYANGPVAHINAHMQNQVRFVVLYRNMFGRAPSHYANDFIDEYYKKMNPVFTVKIQGKEFAWVYEKPSYPHSIGDLTPQAIAIQEVVVSNEGLAGFDILPATRGGQVRAGTYGIELSKSITGAPIYSADIAVSDVTDSRWYSLTLPDSVAVAKGDHIFIRIRGLNVTSPYPSIRFAGTVSRSTPVYIIRNGDIESAQPKMGSLGVRLTYHAIDGTIATETQTKLLR